MPRPIGGVVVPGILQQANNEPSQRTLSIGAPPERLIEPTNASYGGMEPAFLSPTIVPAVYPSPSPIGSWVVM